MKFVRPFASFLFLCLTFASARAQTPADTLQVYPNPFADVLHVNFSLTTSDTVTLWMFDASGQTVAVLFDQTLLPTGQYALLYDGTALPDGMYLLQLKKGQTSVYNQRVTKQGSSGAIHQGVLQSGFLVTPNPTTGELTIPMDGNKKIVVTDVSGRVVLTDVVASRTCSVSGLSRGEYVVRMFGPNDRLVLSQKIIKTD